MEFYPIKGDISKIVASDDIKVAMKADSPLKLFLSFRKMKNYVVAMQEDLFNACADSQAIVYHPGAAIGYFAAQHHKIPSILATPFPMSTTSEYPALIFYDKPRFGKTYNRVTHKIFEKIMWMASNKAIRHFWKARFGSLPKDYGCPFGKQASSGYPTIISCSNHVFPRPSDWQDGIHNTGYWFLDDDKTWQPPQELLDFLNKGKPPVYVGFGSIGDTKSAEQTTSIVLEALKLTGQRGILATGWGSMLKPDTIPEDVFFLEGAPHDWIFPKMSAVVHHGGAGTTAACLRAGIPSVVVPFCNDQFAWGRKVYELGKGSKAIPRKTLTARKFSEAINFALEKEISCKAKELGKLISCENGAENAARVVIAAVNYMK